jgi:hypothetical protein
MNDTNATTALHCGFGLVIYSEKKIQIRMMTKKSVVRSVALTELIA